MAVERTLVGERQSGCRGAALTGFSRSAARAAQKSGQRPDRADNGGGIVRPGRTVKEVSRRDIGASRACTGSHSPLLGKGRAGPVPDRRPSATLLLTILSGGGGFPCFGEPDMAYPIMTPALADTHIVKLLMDARAALEAASQFARLSGRPALMSQIEATLIAGCTDTALSLLPDPVACPADHDMTLPRFGTI